MDVSRFEIIGGFGGSLPPNCYEWSSSFIFRCKLMPLEMIKLSKPLNCVLHTMFHCIHISLLIKFISIYGGALSLYIATPLSHVLLANIHNTHHLNQS